MSKFDLEAAKRGDAVQVKSLKGWVDAHFVGVDTTGKLVIEYKKFFVYPASGCDEIRMKPKQREMWIFPYSSDGVIFTSTPCETMDEAEIVKKHFPKPAGEVQAILVEE
tara:strand:+ start:166 stop:492 length:327 start_codon:yes stop_codon:yes gene_type:complete